MATLEQKREARRRKILENSGNRMKKLLGQDYDGQGDEPPLLVSQTQVAAEPKEVTTSSDNMAFSSNDSCASDFTLTNLKNMITSTQPREGELQSSSVSDSSVSTSESSLNTKMYLKTLDRTRFCSCICLAIIVRWMLSSGFGLFYFESIFFPFAALEIAIYSYLTVHMKEMILPHSSSMMAGALMLSGIKPDVIATYNKLMGYMTAVTEDCGLYIFTFIIAPETPRPILTQF